MAEQALLVNGAQAVGSIILDETRIQGVGGPDRPQLVIPATVAMAVRPDESAMAVTELRASLRPGAQSFHGDTIGQPVFLDLATGFLGWSRPDIESKHPIELRIPFAAVDIEDVERRRHQDEGGRVQLALFLDPVVEGVLHFNQQQPGRVNEAHGPWDEPRLGMYSQRFTFWTSSVNPITFTIEMSQWVESILPKLGYNQLRLIELRLPPLLPDHGAAATEFDKARVAFDQRRYPECIAACRSLVNMWNRQLASTKTAPMGVVVGDKLDWPTDDCRREFVSQIWTATLNLVNVPLHPEGQPDPQEFKVHETKLLFRQVALLSEFLAAVVAGP